MKTKMIIAVLLISFIMPFMTWGAQKTITTYARDTSIVAKGGGGSYLPPVNTPVISASFNAVLAALVIPPGNMVASVAYQDSNGCESIWATFQNYTMSTDQDTSCNNIGSLVVPLKSSTTQMLRDTWTTYGSVSYDIQVKVGWYVDLRYAAQGINIRWKESSIAGKYEGYGISFINFNSQTKCTGNDADNIPNTMKPGSNNDLNKTLLLVLWQQKVVGGIEKKTWLSYAILGVPGSKLSKMNDPKVIGDQSSQDSRTITDNSTLVVRVEDVKSGTQRYNDIKIYYGDPSINSTRTSGTRGFDSAATNINRGVYLPKCSDNVFPSWPSNMLEAYSIADKTWTYWSYLIWSAATPYVLNNTVIPVNRLASDGLAHSYKCTTAGTTGQSEPVWPIASGSTVNDNGVVWKENGKTRPTVYDYFTLLSTNPKISNNSVQMVTNAAYVNDIVSNNNPTATVVLQADRATIRTTDYTLDTYPATKQEIALHAMGDLTGSDTVAFQDLAIKILGRRE